MFNSLWNLTDGVAIVKRKAEELNQLAILDYYQRLRSIAVNTFKWEGFPFSVSSRFLEETLFDHGWALFFSDPNLGYLGMKGTMSGKLNHYHEPTRYRAWSIDYSIDLDADECILVRNNYMGVPTAPTILMYAQRLAEVERTIDVNVDQQKTPLVVLCDEKQRLTFLNVLKQRKDNEITIFGDKSLDLSGVKVLKTDAPYLADKLMKYKHDLWNECMTFLGVNNVNTEKKERMITDEAQSNNELIQASADVRLTPRQEAVDLINKKYGLNVKVSLRTELMEDKTPEEKGDEDNG